MSLLPESASFEERVVDCFLTLRGRGLEVSALDRPVLTAWAQAGVPFEVVARGLQLAAEKALWDAVPGEPLLRSLRACRRTVDAEIRRHLRHSAGGRTSAAEPVGPGAWELERIRSLAAEVEAWRTAHPVLDAGAQRVLQLLAAPGLGDGVLARCEDAVALGMLRALSPPAEAGALGGGAGGAGGGAAWLGGLAETRASHPAARGGARRAGSKQRALAHRR